MKYEWKKLEKELYGAKKEPAILQIPSQNFIMLSGKGNPNHPDFSEKVSALFSLAYAVKMNFKSVAANSALSGDITDYAVYPLEGIWKQADDQAFDKEQLEYTIMIRQPDFITGDMVQAALEKVKIKKPNPYFEEICFGSMSDGACVDILHIGPFDEEPVSFDKMNQFIKENNLKRRGQSHREIYLNNLNRVEKSKLKTILRYLVE